MASNIRLKMALTDAIRLFLVYQLKKVMMIMMKLWRDIIIFSHIVIVISAKNILLKVMMLLWVLDNNNNKSSIKGWSPLILSLVFYIDLIMLVGGTHSHSVHFIFCACIVVTLYWHILYHLSANCHICIIKPLRRWRFREGDNTLYKK